MKVNNEIKKMNANELLDIHADKVEEIQNWEEEMTILKFEDATAHVCGSDVKWFSTTEKLYKPSENVSQIEDVATREDFYNWFLECEDWYRSAVQNDEFEGSIEDYAEHLCETELTLIG